jgi:hypothetical protein
MNSRIAAIARYTLLEALRTRLPALALLALALAAAASFFVESIAITDSARFRIGFFAGAARWAAVFIVAFHVLGAVAREFHDKGLDVLLALDLPRSHYVLGRLAGFLAVAAVLAAAACVPLVGSVAAPVLAQWGISLAFELAIVAALALLAAVTFTQVLPAAACVAGCYVLARALTALRLMSENPIGGADTLSHQAIRLFMEGLALVVPAFDGWTSTGWLVDHPASWESIAAIGIHGALYVSLLAGAAMFDLYRKNF